MVRVVRVTILSQCHVLVAMHDLYLPVISVELQNAFRCRRCYAGYQVCGFYLAFYDLACSDMLAITGDARDTADRGPCIAHVCAERVCGEEFDVALINSSVTGLWLFLPVCEGGKPAR